MGEGSSKAMIFSNVAGKVLNKNFNDKNPDYPSFTDLLQPLSQRKF